MSDPIPDLRRRRVYVLRDGTYSVQPPGTVHVKWAPDRRPTHFTMVIADPEEPLATIAQRAYEQLTDAGHPVPAPRKVSS